MTTLTAPPTAPAPRSGNTTNNIRRDPTKGSQTITKVDTGGDIGAPMPAPWRLNLLADDGQTTHVNVPDAASPSAWDQAEALVTSALTGMTFHPAGREARA